MLGDPCQACLLVTTAKEWQLTALALRLQVHCQPCTTFTPTAAAHQLQRPRLELKPVTNEGEGEDGVEG